MGAGAHEGFTNFPQSSGRDKARSCLRTIVREILEYQMVNSSQTTNLDRLASPRSPEALKFGWQYLPEAKISQARVLGLSPSEGFGLWAAVRACGLQSEHRRRFPSLREGRRRRSKTPNLGASPLLSKTEPHGHRAREEDLKLTASITRRSSKMLHSCLGNLQKGSLTEHPITVEISKASTPDPELPLVQAAQTVIGAGCLRCKTPTIVHSRVLEQFLPWRDG